MNITIISLGGITNFGERVILLGTIANLKKKYHSPSFTLLGYTNICDQDKFICNYFSENNVKILPAIIPPQTKIRKILSIVRLLISPKSVLSKEQKASLSDADLVISKGQESFTAAYGIVHFIDSFLEAYIASKLNKNVVLYGQSIGPLSNAFEISTTKFVLKNIAKVYTRDDISLAVLNKLGYRRGKRIKDLAFEGVPVFAIKPIEKQKKILIVPNYAIIKNIGKDRYLSTLLFVIDFLIEKGFSINAASSVTATDWNNDYILCKELHEKKKAINVINLLDSQEFLTEINESTAVVSSRLHPIIFSMSLNTPIIAISSAVKVRGILADSKATYTIIDPKKVSDSELSVIAELILKNEY